MHSEKILQQVKSVMLGHAVADALGVPVEFESREKLKKYRPENLAQASRIPGVNPADIAVLAVIIKRGHA